MTHNSCPQNNYVYVAIRIKRRGKWEFATQKDFQAILNNKIRKNRLRVEYIGITKNLKSRASKHFHKLGREIHKLPFYENGTLTRKQAHAIEQLLIDHYKLENLSNVINSVARDKFNSGAWDDERDFAQKIMNALSLLTDVPAKD